MIDPANVLLLYRAGDERGTFTRATTATYVDIDGYVRSAASGVARDAHYELGLRTILLEAASTNLVTESEDLNSWSKSGATPITDDALTCGVLNLALVTDASAATPQYIYTAPTFTGNAIKAVSFFVRAGTAVTTVVQLYDATAGTPLLHVSLAWSLGVPTATASTGSVLRTITLADGTYRVECVTASVTAANTNQIRIYPAGTGAAAGTVYLGGVQAENKPYPSSYIPTDGGTATRNADVQTLTLTLPTDENLTVYALLARPTHAAASGTLGFYPAIWQYGSSAAGMGVQFQSTARQTRAWMTTSDGADALALNLPTDTQLFHALQYVAATGLFRVRTGTTWSSYSSTTTVPLSGWGSTTLTLGDGDSPGTAQELDGGLAALVIAQGQHDVEDMALLCNLPYIAFDDGTETQLVAGVPTLNGWRPDAVKVGDAVERLSDATRYLFEFRVDYTAEFTVPILRPVQLETALRLKEHLLEGGTCTVSTADTEANVYTCRLAPGTEPDVEFSDPSILDYGMRLTLKNTSAVAMVARYR